MSNNAGQALNASFVGRYLGQNILSVSIDRPPTRPRYNETIKDLILNAFRPIYCFWSVPTCRPSFPARQRYMSARRIPPTGLSAHFSLLAKKIYQPMELAQG